MKVELQTKVILFYMFLTNKEKERTENEVKNILQSLFKITIYNSEESKNVIAYY